jgi:hypothetical protein
MALRFLLVLLVAAFASGASCARVDAPAFAQAASVLVIESTGGEHRFQVELADTDEKRAQGLMYRTELADNAGMLFDFGPTPRPVSMWMKNTLIPLDMAFIAADGRIVTIVEMTTPQSLASIRSGEDVLAVLEVRGGRFGELGVRPGDRIRHPLFAQN